MKPRRPIGKPLSAQHVVTLPIPLEVQEQGGSEILKAALAEDGSLHMTIRTRAFGFKPESDEAIISGREVWGIFVVDLVRHIARIFEREEGCDYEETIDLLMTMAAEELMEPTDEGRTEPIQEH